MTVAFIQTILLNLKMDNHYWATGTTCHGGKKEVVNVTPQLM